MYGIIYLTILYIVEGYMTTVTQKKYFDNFENLPTNRAKGIVIYVKGANLSTKKFASAQKIIL